MDRFDLLDRMLELKTEMLLAEEMKDWHKREELERKLVEVKKMLKEFNESIVINKYIDTIKYILAKKSL